MKIIKFLTRPNWLDTLMMREIWGILLWICLGFVIPVSTVSANENIEHQVKTAFIYNFIAYTRWPEGNEEGTLALCVYGENGLGKEIDKLTGRPVNKQKIHVRHIVGIKNLQECQAIFFSKTAKVEWPSVLKELKNKPILTLADSKDAASQGVSINMDLVKEKIVFEINLGVAQASGLSFSSKLLNLAKRVYQ